MASETLVAHLTNVPHLTAASLFFRQLNIFHEQKECERLARRETD
jgi:hypothetical protein